MVSWTPPTDGWVKLNIDGSCMIDSGAITAGGVLRNSQKDWIKGFVLNKGLGSALEAELWGMFEGLTMAWKAGFKKVIAETDSITIVQFLNYGTNSNHPLFSLIQSCRDIMNAEWSCTVQHVYREGNMVADGLAHLGHDMDTGLWVFEDPPVEIINFVDADARGTTCLRQRFVPFRPPP